MKKTTNIDPMDLLTAPVTEEARIAGDAREAEYNRKLDHEAATKVTKANYCRRCGGSGYIRSYDHVEAGVCFKCGGTGVSN